MLVLWLRCGCSRVDQFLPLRLGPSRLAELRQPPLVRNTFQEGVIVKRACYDRIETLDIPGPEIDPIRRADRKTRHESRVAGHHEGRRSSQHVDTQAKRVAKVRWSEEEQYQIRSIGN